MKLDIPYGDDTMHAELPDDTFVVPGGGSKPIEPIEDMDAAVAHALMHPLGAAPIPELVKKGDSVVIAFDDCTVPCFSPVRAVAIRECLNQLDQAGVKRGDIKLICANSLHRKFRPEELATIIGHDLVEEFGEQCFCHDAENPDELAYLGKTDDHGYDVELSKHAVDSDLTIYVNAACGRGFSGGWKSVAVGLSTFRSIRHHHTPDGMSMSVKDNRMHKVLDEMGKHIEKNVDTNFFKIDSVESNPFQTGRVFAGDTWKCREAVLNVLEDHYPPRRSLSDERYDVIIYGVPNWSPYAIFSHMNPLLTLVSSGLGYLGGTIQALGKEGCSVIMVTPCPEQWDRVHHPSYPDVWDNVLPYEKDPYKIEAEYTDKYISHEQFIDKYRHHYAFHPVHGILATHPLKRLKHAGQVIVAGIEDLNTAHHLGFDAADTVEQALELAREKQGPSATVAYAQHPAAPPTKITM